MYAHEPITFAVPVSDREIFEANFLASPFLRDENSYQILKQESFASASRAYNDAIERSANDLIVFVHQDVFFPKGWTAHLRRALGWLDERDPGWGVLGSWGARKGGGFAGHIYSTGLGVLGQSFDCPLPVQTLDEAVLVLRKSSGLRFDESLPHFHFYGTDICMIAAAKGMSSYAISAFCIHNTRQILVLPEEFYICYKHIKQSWKQCLPIETTCISITRYDFALYERKLRELYLKYCRRLQFGAARLESLGPLPAEWTSAGNDCH